MSGSSSAPRGADILMQALADQGVRRAFGVPGESFLSVLDAILDVPDMDFVTTRHEGGAVYMAEAHGKLTGRPGICFVTRGPGAMHAAIGVHTAQQDSTPMILFVGQVARRFKGREAFQEVDFHRHFSDMAKWSDEIDDADRITEFVGRAFHAAMAGRPGPVVLALPEDMLDGPAQVQPRLAPVTVPQPAPSRAELDRLRNLLVDASRPFVIAGGGGWSREAADQLLAWAERDALPVACELRCQDLFDNLHPNYAGDIGFGVPPGVAERIRSADCLILLGARMGEIPSAGYTLIDAPRPAQSLVHIHAGPEETGRVYQADLAITATPAGFLEAVLDSQAVTGGAKRRDWTRGCHSAHEAAVAAIPPAPGAVDLAVVLGQAREIMGPRTIVTNGAGNYANWVHKVWRFRSYRTQLGPVAGGMGYGLPAAVAAALEEPDRPVLAVAGDGCFLMTAQELSTAVEQRLGIVILVVNNGMLGTIRMHQERHYPGRVSATDLVNPDFVALARSYGAWAATVKETGAFADCLKEALDVDGPALIDLHVDPEAISLFHTLSQVRGTR